MVGATPSSRLETFNRDEGVAPTQLCFQDYFVIRSTNFTNAGLNKVKPKTISPINTFNHTPSCLTSARSSLISASTSLISARTNSLVASSARNSLYKSESYFYRSLLICSYSAVSRKLFDFFVISTTGRNLRRWRHYPGLRFLALLGMT